MADETRGRLGRLNRLTRMHQQYEDGADSLFQNLPEEAPTRKRSDSHVVTSTKDANDLSIYDYGFNAKRFEDRISALYQIEDKKSRLMTAWGPLLRRNSPQKKLLRLILRRLELGGPVRVLVLKNRKVGASTATVMLFLEICSFLSWTCAILAHTDDSSKKLLSIARRAYAAISEEHKNKLISDRDNRLEWGPSKAQRALGTQIHEAKLISMTAQGDYVSSGDTISAMLLSECAKYDSIGSEEAQQKFILSAIGSIPKVGPSLIVAETTANGQQGWFWNNWRIARTEEGKNHADGNNWIPFFISWLEDPDCARRVEEGYDWKDWPHEDFEKEKWLLDQGATLTQLRFRRWTIQNDMSMDRDLFDQEFPTNDTIAFLSGGRPAVDRSLISKWMKTTRPPIACYMPRMVQTSMEDFSVEIPGGDDGGA